MPPSSRYHTRQTWITRPSWSFTGCFISGRAAPPRADRAPLRPRGTPYDVPPLTTVRTAFGEHSFVAGSPRQILWLILLPQLLVWPLYTIAAGLLGAGLAGLVMAPRRPGTPARAAEGPLRPNGGPS